MSYNPQVSSDPVSLRTGAATNSLDASPTALRAQNWNQAVFFVDVTLDTATDARIRFDVAAPTATASGTAVSAAAPAAGSAEWKALVFQDNGGKASSGGVSTVPIEIFEIKIAASGSYAFPLPLNYQWIRAKAKVTGTAGAATIAIKATTGLA